jgi:ABC-type uncharacterized transport system auxiliary subunit
MTRVPRRRRGRRPAQLALACLLAAGCLGRPAPADRHFRLALAPPARLATPALPGVLEVDRPRAHAVARQTALVYVTDPGGSELRTRAYEHWADSPTLLVQRETAAWLHAAGLAERVVTPEPGAQPDYRLTGELVRFEEQRGSGVPRVVVELAFVLVDLRSREVLLQETYREERDAEGPGAEHAVRAYDAALAAVLARLVADAGTRP